MRYITKNTCIITFSDSYKNVFDRSVAKEKILIKSIITRSNVKLVLRKPRQMISQYDKHHELAYDRTELELAI